jgi:hypothetical protein
MNELEQMLEQARHRTVTPEEREKQRISFAYGNARLSNPQITRDSMKEAAAHLAANPVTLNVTSK